MPKYTYYADITTSYDSDKSTDSGVVEEDSLDKAYSTAINIAKKSALKIGICDGDKIIVCVNECVPLKPVQNSLF